MERATEAEDDTATIFDCTSDFRVDKDRQGCAQVVEGVLCGRSSCVGGVIRSLGSVLGEMLRDHKSVVGEVLRGQS
ncbi:hypothetical protein PV326_006209 [Microctonus aethiopoides]|nr:hypothetical protein PV326_006209 [Microctonus aethiopoides]